VACSEYASAFLEHLKADRYSHPTATRPDALRMEAFVLILHPPRPTHPVYLPQDQLRERGLGPGHYALYKTLRQIRLADALNTPNQFTDGGRLALRHWLGGAAKQNLRTPWNGQRSHGL